MADLCTVCHYPLTPSQVNAGLCEIHRQAAHYLPLPAQVNDPDSQLVNRYGVDNTELANTLEHELDRWLERTIRPRLVDLNVVDRRLLELLLLQSVSLFFAEERLLFSVAISQRDRQQQEETLRARHNQRAHAALEEAQ